MFGPEKQRYFDTGLNRNEDLKEERKMDIRGLLSTPMGIGIVIVVGLVLLLAAWKVNKFAVKLLFIAILAAIAAAVVFFKKGGF